MQVCDDKLGSCHWSSDSFDFECYFCVRVNLLLPWLQTHRSCKHNQTTAGTAINSRAPRAYEQSPMAKKMWLLFHFHPMNFGSHVTVRTSTRPTLNSIRQTDVDTLTIRTQSRVRVRVRVIYLNQTGIRHQILGGVGVRVMHSRSDAPSSNPTHSILNCFFP